MKRIDFNKGWIFRCLTRDEAARLVDLPHDAMISEPRTMECEAGGNCGWFIGGDYEYRKLFFIPVAYREKKILVEFEGVYHNAEVYLNERKIAERPYGYTNFYVNLSDYIKYGEGNELVVIAHNSEQPNSRWYSGTGIYRSVSLHVGEEKHILVNGVRIRTLSVFPAVIDIRVKTSGTGKVEIKIIKDEKLVASKKVIIEKKEAKIQIEIENALLWSCESPHLYTCLVTFGNDVVEEQFGIRKISWKEGTFSINGKRVILRGACIHHDNGILGACAFPEAEERKIKILKENGYNAIRSAHNPCSKALLGACDKIGMMVVDEYTDMWYIHKTKYDYASEVKKWWKQDLRDMVNKDYNHPCVIMYSTGNEVAETSEKRGIRFTAAMTKYLHKLDSTRPVTCGINIFFNFLYSIGLGVYSDHKAEKQSGLIKKKKRAVGSEFYNRMAVAFGDRFMKFGATLYPCDLKTKDAYERMDIAGYNYGIDRYLHDVKKYPNRLILGSETFCKDTARFWQIAKRHPQVIGDFVWPGIAYLGEVGDDMIEYKAYKLPDHSKCIGVGGGRIDILGKPTVEANYTKIAYELENGPYIAVTPVDMHQHLKLSGWQLSKGIESWSFDGYEGKMTDVEVFARGKTVVLFVNGISSGKKIIKDNCRVIFKVPYHSGILEAVSYDENGTEIGRSRLKSANKNAILQIISEQSSAEPEKLLFLWFRYTDEEGIWKPTERHKLLVNVKNGTLLGFGNACSYTEYSYTEPIADTYFGEAMAVIRAGKEGNVKITAEDENNIKILEVPIK